MALTTEQNLERAVLALMRDPDYMMLGGMFLFGKATVVDTGITARTNGTKVQYGRAFFDALTDPERRGLVLHETMHMVQRDMVVYRHLFKQDADRANRAADYVINLPIQDRHLRDGFVKLPDGGCIDEKYRGMDMQQVFDMLTPGEGGGHTDDHDWENADDSDETATDIAAALREGGILASKAGGKVDRALLDSLLPQVDWRQALRDFVSNYVAGGDESSYRRIDRRMLAQDVMAPAAYSQQVDSIAVCVDTSGSIDDAALADFMAEVAGICESVRPASVDLLYWGSDVVAHETYPLELQSGLRTSTRPVGGGGTSPSCITQYLHDHSLRPTCIVVITDGHVFGDWGKAWPAPLLWCITTPSTTAPNGCTVHVNHRR